MAFATHTAEPLAVDIHDLAERMEKEIKAAEEDLKKCELADAEVKANPKALRFEKEDAAVAIEEATKRYRRAVRQFKGIRESIVEYEKAEKGKRSYVEYTGPERFPAHRVYCPGSGFKSFNFDRIWKGRKILLFNDIPNERTGFPRDTIKDKLRVDDAFSRKMWADPTGLTKPMFNIQWTKEDAKALEALRAANREKEEIEAGVKQVLFGR